MKYPHFVTEFPEWTDRATFIATIDECDVWRFVNGFYLGVYGDGPKSNTWVITSGGGSYDDYFSQEIIDFCKAHQALMS